MTSLPPRGAEFKAFLYDIIKTSGLKVGYINKLLSPKGLIDFGDAFTSPSVNSKHNYEFYEFIGDALASHIVVRYMSKRFPQFNTPYGKTILSRMKIEYISKEKYSQFADKLGFWPYIAHDTHDVDRKGQYHNKPKLLEDVFEAFFGVLEKSVDAIISDGAGFKICYNIFAKFLDTIPMSLEYKELWDPVTRLKEIEDKYQKVWRIKYFSDESLENRKKGHIDTSKDVNTEVWLYKVTGWYDTGKPILVKDRFLSNAVDNDAKKSKRMAAAQAIPIINSLGYYKDVPFEYAIFSE